MKKSKGKSIKSKVISLLQVSALAIMSHPFGSELTSWEKGVTVDCGTMWSREAMDLAIDWGPHPTAKEADAVALVQEGTDYHIKAGFTEFMCWDEIKDDLPEHLKYHQLP
jgi:hypothetical protein